MTFLELKLIESYTILVIANRMKLEEVPATGVIREDGSKSTIQKEVEVKIAERTIDALS